MQRHLPDFLGKTFVADFEAHQSFYSRSRNNFKISRRLLIKVIALVIISPWLIWCLESFKAGKLF